MICAFSESTRLSEYSETSFLQTALKRLRLLDDFISIPRVCLGRLLWFGHDVLTEAGTHLFPRKFSAYIQVEDEGEQERERARKRQRREKQLQVCPEDHPVLNENKSVLLCAFSCSVWGMPQMRPGSHMRGLICLDHNIQAVLNMHWILVKQIYYHNNAIM